MSESKEKEEKKTGEEKMEWEEMEEEEEPKFLTIKQITYYAAKKYEYVRRQVPFPKNEGHSCSAYCTIENTLREHNLIPPKKSKSRTEAKSESGAESGSKPKVNAVSREIAHFVVDELLFEKFANDKEILQRQTERQEASRLEKLKRESRSRETAKRLTEKGRELFLLEREVEELVYAGEYVDLQEILKKYPELAEDFNDDVHKDTYRYHLPNVPWYSETAGDVPGISKKLVNQVVDRMMVRTLFDKFFYFNETRFRRDFIERSKLISSDNPVTYEEGYDELTKQLENPMGTYVFPKDKIRNGLRITVEPETEKRIRKYASERGISVQELIDEWIWSIKLKDE